MMMAKLSFFLWFTRGGLVDPSSHSLVLFDLPSLSLFLLVGKSLLDCDGISTVAGIAKSEYFHIFVFACLLASSFSD